MSKAIVLYDVAAEGSKAEERAWSPNAWRIRYALGIKGLPFKTVWVEFPDIADAAKKIGAAPTVTLNGASSYTLPVIHDLSTGKVVSDSWAIAEYLDETYPDRPTVLPKPTRGLQSYFVATARDAIIGDLANIVVFSTYKHLRPRGQDYFRATREKLFGRKLEDFPQGEQLLPHWAKLEAGFGKFADAIKKNGEGSQFITGDTISFADLVLAGWLIWLRQVRGAEDWEKVRSWNGGFWGRYLDFIHKHAVFDEGEEYQA
ncbi:hypothetical protein PUNSTDRAFT_114205 [Punctularia strigosozonata HHB-11173 SS5]|uniref:uncharacterized protein n=1 Tax=Punctularia strigosozonata (strain HHB-11173) TaxID=741275 RepID=UPI0004417DD6|nr:uncharacterized protein PUNSTDRAFT_114205 [Punctularia strigosozonata HHB-11173 SS5]EIN07718.1 hypothetical protein PUNSTDRAFT_114205 [Punctularia strigosozonata HHB-11173 SS5]